MRNQAHFIWKIKLVSQWLAQEPIVTNNYWFFIMNQVTHFALSCLSVAMRLYRRLTVDWSRSVALSPTDYLVYYLSWWAGHWPGSHRVHLDLRRSMHDFDSDYYSDSRTWSGSDCSGCSSPYCWAPDSRRRSADWAEHDGRSHRSRTFGLDSCSPSFWRLLLVLKVQIFLLLLTISKGLRFCFW